MENEKCLYTFQICEIVVAFKPVFQKKKNLKINPLNCIKICWKIKTTSYFGICNLWSYSVKFISEIVRDRKYVDILTEALNTINSKKKICIKICWKIKILCTFQNKICVILDIGTIKKKHCMPHLFNNPLRRSFCKKLH